MSHVGVSSLVGRENGLPSPTTEYNVGREEEGISLCLAGRRTASVSHGVESIRVGRGTGRPSHTSEVSKFICGWPSRASSPGGFGVSHVPGPVGLLALPGYVRTMVNLVLGNKSEVSTSN